MRLSKKNYYNGAQSAVLVQQRDSGKGHLKNSHFPRKLDRLPGWYQSWEVAVVKHDRSMAAKAVSVGKSIVLIGSLLLSSGLSTQAHERRHRAASTSMWRT